VAPGIEPGTPGSVVRKSVLLCRLLVPLILAMFILCYIEQYPLAYSYRYESFDFHAECRHLRWDRLSILIDRLAHEQDEFGCFLLTRDGTLVSLQDGVFRTNCIDCLDRTNVVQSMLARRSLTQIMQVSNNCGCFWVIHTLNCDISAYVTVVFIVLTHISNTTRNNG
jgi:hypothetical protein